MDLTTIYDDRSEFCFFDFETTFPIGDGQVRAILEFGAILVCPERLVELDRYSSLVRPDDLSSIPPALVRLNGVSRNEIAEARSFSEIADEVHDFLHGKIWVGHSIEKFDCVRLREAFEKIGRPAPEPKGIMDTLDLLKQTFGRRAATLANYFGIGEQTHRSLDDARKNLEVIKHCATASFMESKLPDIYAGFLELDEVSLFCPRLRVRLGIRPTFVDQFGLPRLNFVVDAPPILCKVLETCVDAASSVSKDYGSTSKWRPVVDYQYDNSPTVRLHIPTIVEGDIARHGTEIHQRDCHGGVQKLVFNRFDAEELCSLFRTGVLVDAFFCLETYDYQEGAGIGLVAKKLVIRSY